MINKEIFRLAIPNILSNISIPLLSTVDTAIMGRFSEVHIGAVGLGAMIFNFIYWNFGFLRMGTTGLTAQAFGREDKADIIHTLCRAVVLSLVLASLLLLVQRPFGRTGAFLMNVNGEQMDMVLTYFHIRIWAAPATLGLYAFFGWFFGMQNAIYPLILTVCINVANILFNFLFVFGLGMEVDGVAWATVIAQYIGLILALVMFRTKYRSYLIHIKSEIVLQWDAISHFLQINKDIFIRTLCLTLVFGFFYSQSAKGGETVLAVNVILLQLLNWMSYGIDGFAYATESLVGKYAGAGDNARLNISIKMSFVWAFVGALLYSLMYGFFGRTIIEIYTDQENLITETMQSMYWMVILPIVGFACYIWDGVFIGLTASKAMRDSMLISFALFFACFYLLYPHYGNNGLWVALLLFLFARGVIQTLMYYNFPLSKPFK